MLTTQQLKSMLPLVNDVAMNYFIPHLNTYMPQFEIDTPERIGGFISQIGEESANLKYTLEIASGKEYEHRADLGNTIDGDGIKFKGRGLIQITGRNMYKQCSEELFNSLVLLDKPQILETPQYATQSACWFWDKVKSLNHVCDLPNDWIHPGVHQYSKFQWMTILINGGLNGYDVRLANYLRAKKVLGF